MRNKFVVCFNCGKVILVCCFLSLLTSRLLQIVGVWSNQLDFLLMVL